MFIKFVEDLEEFFNKFMQFKDSIIKVLEGICGYYVESKFIVSWFVNVL